MPTRLCSTPRCPDPATYRGRCQRHAKQRNKDTHRNRSVYNSKRWQILRRRVLFDQPLCPGLDGQGCGEIAEQVDHIVAIEHGGKPFDRANLQGLCASCHGKKTKREMTSR